MDAQSADQFWAACIEEDEPHVDSTGSGYSTCSTNSTYSGSLADGNQGLTTGHMVLIALGVVGGISGIGIAMYCAVRAKRTNRKGRHLDGIQNAVAVS